MNMRLIAFDADGVPGAPRLHLDSLAAVTTLVGPNGSGKSTILQVLLSALSILSKGTVCDRVELADPWLRFSSCRLVFQRPPEAGPLPQLAEYPTCPSEVRVNIAVQSGKRFVLQSIKLDSTTLTTVAPTQLWPRADIDALNKQLESLEKTINASQDRLNTGLPQPEQARLQEEMARLGEQRVNVKKQLEPTRVVSLLVEGLTQQQVHVSRSEVDAFLSALQFPFPIHIPPKAGPDGSIDKLIDEALALKVGKPGDERRYREAVTRLAALLQAEVTFFKINDEKCLTIDGVDYRHASTGTATTLAFFGLTRMADPRGIVLWDEPENGLHPTRRCRMLDLMLNDTRQFIVATHATEFAPVFPAGGRVFRCYADYDPGTERVSIAARDVTTRRDAFEAVESLGLQPARVFFTANVVIWVEGPTELVFLRHWLSRALANRGYLEGFHYTIMQYGGGLISFLEVCDDSQRLGMFDLLSICSHPVILVDSDLTTAPPSPAEQVALLKPGARRIAEEVTRLNSERREAALFCCTHGKEIENYLPPAAIAHAVEKLWALDGAVFQRLALHQLEFPRYVPYDETIRLHLEAHRLLDDDGKPRGRTVWGSRNKVALMRHALSLPSLREQDLLWNGAELIRTISDFVVRHNRLGDGGA